MKKPNRKRIEEICRAAELSQEIEFRDGREARLYREVYVKTHTGVIDAEAVETRKRLPAKAGATGT